ncbi:hypothetical protein ACQPZ8_05730 [Actinomadura nitritigenes]|uniref:hypothetical protein n=1 Tax=Actinomadura nitritigenes TaxID=134602 RepID=UPI003D89DDD2
MSYELYFWKSAAGEPDDICDRLADEDVEGVAPSSDVERFRSALLGRWPDLADRIAPWAPDLDWRQPWGREDLAAYFVSLSLSLRTEASALEDVVTLARQHSLVTHDPQTGETIR